MNPFNNESTEQAAKDIAKAIYEDDRTSYEQLMTNHKVILDNMVRWELIAFRERVHYLVKQYGSKNKRFNQIHTH